MAVPNIATLPEAPNRGDAPSDFSAKADTFVAALPPFVAQTNAVVAAINAYAPTIDGAAAAGAQASAAAVTATAAAAAAGAAINLAPYGNPGDSLQVNAARNGLVFGPNDGNVGDIRYGLKSPGSLWVPASAGIRSQISMPTLFAALGLLSPNVAQAWATVTPSPAITGTVVDISSNPNTGVVIAVLAGTVGAAMKSLDFGVTWASFTIAALAGATANCITCDGNGVWLIGTTTGITRSTDDGVTWVAVAGFGGGISRISMSASGVAVACLSTTSQGVWVSSSSGAGFSLFDTGLTAIHTCVANDGKGTWIVAAGTQLRRSVNDGLTWSLAFTAAQIPTCMATDKKGNWLISGATANGGTYETPDNGVTWNLIAMATASVTDITYAVDTFVVVRSVSPQVGYLSTAADSVVMTFPATGVLASASRVTSSGKGIFNVSTTANTNVLRSIPNYGYDNTAQFKLPDVPAPNGLQAWVKAGLQNVPSGASFLTYGSTSVGAPTAMATDGASTIITVNLAGSIRRSIDGGNSWATIASGTTTNLVCVETNNKGVWLIGAAGLLLRSTDNGASFAAVSGMTTGTISNITFGLNDVAIIAYSTTAPPKRSTDLGLTWNTIASTPATAAMRFATDSLANWVGVTSNTGFSSYVSSDNGVTFAVGSSTGLSSAILDLKMFSNGNAIAVQGTGTYAVSTDKGATWKNLTTGSLSMTRLVVIEGGLVLGLYNLSSPPLYNANFGISGGWGNSNLGIFPAAYKRGIGLIGVTTSTNFAKAVTDSYI